MNRVRSLKIMMVFVVFAIMMSAGILTAFCFFFLYALGLLPSWAAAPLFSPFVSLFVYSVIGTFISAVISEKVLKPLNELIRATKAVAAGDFSVRVEESNTLSEMWVLQRNFNHMAEELGSIEMFRNDFIDNFSHEFKTPIVSIRGFARQLRNEDLSPQKRREYADIIVSESERLANMSSNILLLSRLENQQLVTNRKEYDLDEQIRDCVILLEKQWSQKNLDMDMDLEPVRICSDPEMISHLWINLIDNAVKYADMNGQISISCRYAGGDIRFTIGNSGPGMEENTMKHIFDKFYQGDTSHTAAGSGIGLSIVRRIVELCEGEITVSSKLGRGTTFTVRLPSGLNRNS